MNTVTTIEQELITKIASHLRMPVESFDPGHALEGLDLDSIIAVTILSELEEKYSVSLSSTLFWDAESIHDMAVQIAAEIDQTQEHDRSA